MIFQVPETLIGTAIATALLPTISEQVARNDWQSFRQTIERAVQVLLAITLPITTILGFGLQPLVVLAFGPKFQGDQMVTLMGVTQAFLVGLAGQSLLEIAVRAFYAQKNAKIPLLVSGLNMVVFIGLAFLLRPRFGAVGIALAISLAYTGEAVLLFYLLNRRLAENLAISGTLVRGLLAAAAGGTLVWIIMNEVSLPLPSYGLSVIGLMAGVMVSLPLVWKEVRLLFKL
jgi:putative peptidoglycan lipid II flippase